jgi:hypothetical protein
MSAEMEECRIQNIEDSRQPLGQAKQLSADIKKEYDLE